jgi:hypothetical protein
LLAALCARELDALVPGSLGATIAFDPTAEKAAFASAWGDLSG